MSRYYGTSAATHNWGDTGNGLCLSSRDFFFHKLRGLSEFYRQKRSPSSLFIVDRGSQVTVINRRKAMSGKAAKMMFPEKQQSILERTHRSTTAPQRLVQRVGIILRAFTAALNVDIVNIIGPARKQVGLRRRRWQQSFDALVAIECGESQATRRGRFVAATTGFYLIECEICARREDFER